MWWTLLLGLLAIVLVVLIRSDSRKALGVGMILSLLLPCWVTHSFFGQKIDLRIAAALVLLLMVPFDPRRRIDWRFNVGDWAVLAMFFVQVASDSWHDGISMAHCVRAFGEWSLPYIVGRLTIESIDDWKWLTGMTVAAAIFLAALSTTEAISRRNPFSAVFGERPSDQMGKMGIRNGLKRAEGPTRHPIWFGMVQCLLLPWTITAASRSLNGDGPGWWVIAPVCSLFGIAGANSRGPALVAIIIPYLIGVFYWPRARRPLIAIGAIVLCAGFLLQSQVRTAMEKWEGSRSSKMVDLDGERQHLTATSYRWLVLSAYRPAIVRAGFLGYGSARTSSFPVNVPLGPDALQTKSYFWSIDNEFLLILLRCGWLGIFTFIAISASSVWHILQQSSFLAASDRLIPLAIAASLIAVNMSFVVEWMPGDYGFPFMWLCGAANGIRGTPSAALSVRRDRGQHPASRGRH